MNIGSTSTFSRILVPSVAIATGLNAGFALKNAAEGDGRGALAHSLIAGGSGTVALTTMFGRGPASAMLALGGVLAGVAGVTLLVSA